MKKRQNTKSELNEQELGSVAGGRGSIKLSPHASGSGKQITVTANAPCELDATLKVLDTAFGDVPEWHPRGEEYRGWVDYFVDQSTS